ncbi:MAG: hypothetical protein ACW99J_19105 [Candidatus Thorarchaeota archaeon]|jgi:hypothetical protein
MPETLEEYLKAIKEVIEKSEKKEIELVDAYCEITNLMDDFNEREIAA